MYPTSPDVWVCAATFLSAGLILRISIKGGLPYFGALGLVLGLGYLIKTFYFPWLRVLYLHGATTPAGSPILLQQDSQVCSEHWGDPFFSAESTRSHDAWFSICYFRMQRLGKLDWCVGKFLSAILIDEVLKLSVKAGFLPGIQCLSPPRPHRTCQRPSLSRYPWLRKASEFRLYPSS